jgi:hypothetical protein
MVTMIIVLWAAMFLSSLLTPVLGDRRLGWVVQALFWVTALWAAAHPASLGLAEPTDALIPSFLVILAGVILGKIARGVRRAVAEWHHGLLPPYCDTPAATGAPGHQG